MSSTSRFPPGFWRVLSRLNHRVVSKYGPRSKVSTRVLILTTLGRKSGLPHPTPLQFEEVEGVYFVASARGKRADWYRNIEACPQVVVQVGEKQFNTLAELISDIHEIADFLEVRIKRHPGFMRAMLLLEGLPRKYSRADLEEFSQRLAIVKLKQYT